MYEKKNKVDGKPLSFPLKALIDMLNVIDSIV